MHAFLLLVSGSKAAKIKIKFQKKLKRDGAVSTRLRARSADALHTLLGWSGGEIINLDRQLTVCKADMVDTHTETSATWYQWPNIWDFSKCNVISLAVDVRSEVINPGREGEHVAEEGVRYVIRCYNSFLLLTNVQLGLLAELSNRTQSRGACLALVNFTSDDTCDIYDSATNSAFRDTVWIRLVNWSPRATDFLPANCVNVCLFAWHEHCAVPKAPDGFWRTVHLRELPAALESLRLWGKLPRRGWAGVHSDKR